MPHIGQLWKSHFLPGRTFCSCQPASRNVLVRGLLLLSRTSCCASLCAPIPIVRPHITSTLWTPQRTWIFVPRSIFVFSWPAENMPRSHESSETACDLVFYSGAWRTCVCVVSIAIELTTFAFHRMPFHVILFCFIKRFFSGANAECLFRANFLFGFIRLFVFVHVLLMVAKHRGRSKNTIFTLLDVCLRRRRWRWQRYAQRQSTVDGLLAE